MATVILSTGLVGTEKKDISTDQLEQVISKPLNLNSFSDDTEKTSIKFESICSSIKNSLSTIRSVAEKISTPIRCYAVALVIAWIYVIIPEVNYWVYHLIKSEWSAIFILISFVELQDISLPDAKESAYFSSYLIGFIITPILRIFSFFININVGFIRQTNFFSSLPAIVVFLCYGVDVLLYPFQDESGAQSPINGRNTFSSYGDMFLACNPNRKNLELTRFPSSMNNTIDNSNSHSNIYNQSINSCDISNPLRKNSTSSANPSSLVDNGSIISRKNSLNTSETIMSSSLSLYRITKYLPRHYLRCGNDDSSFPECLSDRRIQWVYSCLFIVFFNAFFEFLVLFTYAFRNQSIKNSSNLYRYFIIYIIICAMFRIILKRIGLLVDSRKRGSISLFFVAEVMSLLFYYTFYRVLFESIKTWGIFMTFQTLHLASEWLYPLRATSFAFSLVKRIEKEIPILRGVFLGNYLNESDWLHFISLDFGLRTTIIVSTSLGLLILFITVDYAPWVHIDLKQSDIADVERSVEYIFVAVLMEIVNACLINMVFFAPRRALIFDKVQYCFQNQRFAFVITVIAAILFIDPMFAFLNTDY